MELANGSKFSFCLWIFLRSLLHDAYKHNAYKHTQREIKGIFNHKLSIIVSLERMLISVFRRNYYMSNKYDLIGN